MAHVFPEGRVKESATVTGTGAYSIVGPSGDTFFGFAGEVGDGNTVDYVAVNDALTTVELGTGTVNVGTPTTISRGTIHRSTNANNIVSWPSSTTVTIFATLRGGVIRQGPYNLDGEQLTLSDDGTSHLQESGSTPNQMVLTLGGSIASRMELAGGIPLLTWLSTDSGATPGPFIRGFRDSSSPAVNDLLSEYQFGGRNSAAESITYGAFRGVLVSPTDGAESGAILVRLVTAGSSVEVSRWDTEHFLLGKTTPDIIGPGVEIQTNGRCAFTRQDTADGGAVLALNLASAASGNMIRFFANSTNIGTISVDTGVVTYGTFTGVHWANWAKGHEPSESVPRGTVLVSTDEFYDRELHPQLCNVAVCSERASPRVYGVTLSAEERPDPASIGTARARIIGSARGGDLLQSSAIPGVAERQPDDIVRSRTIGKVTIGDDRADERLVPCVLYCG